MKPLDLCLVVGMFLTGFDSKKLNTLYVDKNMEYHGLLQAFSRTNRVLNEKKRFGKVVCFRDLKGKVDESIKLFSNGNPIEDIVRPPFDDVKKKYQEMTKDLWSIIRKLILWIICKVRTIRSSLSLLSVTSSKNTQRFKSMMSLRRMLPTSE